MVGALNLCQQPDKPRTPPWQPQNMICNSTTIMSSPSLGPLSPQWACINWKTVDHSATACITVTKKKNKKKSYFPLHPYILPSSEHIVFHLSTPELCSITLTLSAGPLKWDSGHGCYIRHGACWRPVVKHVPVHSKPDWLRGERSRSPGASQLNKHTIKPTTAIVPPLWRSCFIRCQIFCGPQGWC